MNLQYYTINHLMPTDKEIFIGTKGCNYLLRLASPVQKDEELVKEIVCAVNMHDDLVHALQIISDNCYSPAADIAGNILRKYNLFSITY